MESTSPFTKTKKWLIAALVTYVLVARLPSLAAPILDINESDFAVQTAVLINGGTPYVDIVEKKPPLVYAFYAAAFAAGGTWNMQAVHILFACLVAATGIVLMSIARRVAGAAAVLPCMALFAAYQAGYDVNDFLTAGTEIPMNLAAAAAALFAVSALKGRQRFLSLVLSGTFIGIAALAKPVVVSFLPAVFVADMWTRNKEGKPAAVVGDALGFVAGFTLPLAVTAGIFAHAGILKDAIRWTWTENLTYAASSLPLSTLLAHGAVRFTIYALVSLPLWILAIGRIVHAWRSKEFSSVDVLMGVWILFTSYTVSLGWRFFPHYFLQFLPPLEILATLGWTTWLSPCLANRRALRFVAFAIGLATPMIAFPTFQTVLAARIPADSKIERAIAAEVAGRTAPADRVFVWGHSSDIYYYARRLPASRFIYCSFLSGSAEGYEETNRVSRRNDEAWSMAMSDLEKRPPALIVDMSGTGIRGYSAFPIEAFPELASYIRDRYREIASVESARLWLRK